MKKKSRFLTGLLSAVMALSLFAMPAAAAAPDDVWTRTQGSITIHKYEYNGSDKTEGTGENTDSVPSDAKALAGAEFSIYKVMNQEELRNYYDGKSTVGNVTVDTYLNEAKDAIKPNQDYSTAVAHEVTGTNGLAVFEKLDLGLYVVIETKTPDKVTSPVAPFLVSVPMTKASNLNEWLYDIHVYPKNGTTYGEVKISKTGRTGSAAETKLNGVTFILEKYDESTKKWNPVETSEADGSKLDLTTDATGVISVKGLSQGKYHFIEQKIEGDNGYIVDQTPIEFEVTASGDIRYGDKTAASITIPVINDKPDIEKKVIDKTNTPTTDTDYSVGDHVPYQVTVTVPMNITKLTTFTVSDTPTNLIYDKNTIAIKYNGKDVPTTAYVLDETAPTNGYTVKFKPDQMTEYAGKDIGITYTATLQTGADQTTTGNPNTVKLDYTNKITVDGNGNPGEGGRKEIHDDAVVYTFKVKVFKKADDTDAALPGVEFDLYKEDNAGTLTDTAASAIGLDPDKHWTKVNEAPLTSGKDGYLEQGGLANGTYYLVETKTAAGYNLLKAPVEVVLNIVEKTEWGETFTYDDDGNIIKHDVDKKSTTFNDSTAPNSGEYTITVINRKGFNLPTTGGFGTLLFSGIGALLVVGGVGVLMSTKKKKGNA